jgi:DNA-binding MarR family transcriptional regulator
MLPAKQLTDVIRQWSEISMRRSGRDFKRFMAETGLSFSHVSVLMRLYHHRGEGSISEVGGHLGVTKAAASQTVDRLVQSGLIERREDPVDRRIKRLALTAKGDALMAEGIAARSYWVEDLAKTLSLEQRDMIISALTLLTEAARKTED